MISRHIVGCILFCFVIVSCRSAPEPPQPAASVESGGWYVASEEPLTFCPNGYKLPGVQYGILDGEYVYLADRKSRFYIPGGKGAQYYRNQALVARDASLRNQEGFAARSVKSKIAWIGNAIGKAATWTVVLVGGTNPPRE